MQESTIAALPFGLNLPDVINFALMMNAIATTEGAESAWRVGCTANFVSSLLLLVFGVALGIRRLVNKTADPAADVQRLITAVLPQVAQAATLAGIALSLISGFNFVAAFSNPVFTLWPLAIVLVVGLQIKRLEYGKAGRPATMQTRTWLVKYPGITVLAVIVLTAAVANICKATGVPNVDVQEHDLLPSYWQFALPRPMWFFSVAELQLAFAYIGVWLPLAIASIVGTVNCAVTALPRGNRPDTVWTLNVSGTLSVISAFLGCPFPCTVYIGQPTFYAAGAGYGYSLINGMVMLVPTFACCCLMSTLLSRRLLSRQCWC